MGTWGLALGCGTWGLGMRGCDDAGTWGRGTLGHFPAVKYELS